MVFVPMSDGHRRFSCLRGSVLTLEGVIGVGKSTLGKYIENYLNSNDLVAKYYPEYVNTVILNQFIRNKEKYAYSFQILMLDRRIHIYREASVFASTGGIAIIDRSINGDYTFANMLYKKRFINDEEWDAYNSIIDNEKLIEPHATIYLNCDSETALRRIGTRGNIAEKTGYSREYLDELAEAYSITRNNINHPLILVDWNTDKKINETEVVGVLDLVRNTLSS